MAQYGVSTSFYVQDDLIPKIDLILARNQDLFKSRSHFFNCAMVREIRRFDTDGKLHKSEESVEAADNQRC